MSAITTARTYANNLVTFIAWDIEKSIPGCIGFDIARIYSDGKERHLAAWVPFKGQKNPKNLPQDTTVWPIQKFCWRDLTVRQAREGLVMRDGEIELRYRIRPLARKANGLEPVPVTLEKTYNGKAFPLSYIDEGIVTKKVKVTQDFGEFRATFTNGILSSQGVAKRLNEIAGRQLKPNELAGALREQITESGNEFREWLSGDVLNLFRGLFEKAKKINGTVRLALYELKDDELVKLLLDNRNRIEIILSTAGSGNKNKTWDTTNTKSRQDLIAAGAKIHHRMFNSSARIGHNKFAILRDKNEKPIAVLTGSTNWTSTGMCGQSNNATLISDRKVARQFEEEWEAMLDDTNHLLVQGTAGTFAQPNNNVQGPNLRTKNGVALPLVSLARGKAALWFSPNTKRTSKGKDCPPDLGVLYNLMRKANDAILFACFQPSGQGKTSIIAEAIDIGTKDRSLLVFGSVSDRSAMPVSPLTKDRDGDGKISAEEQANTYRDHNIQVVLATALGVNDLVGAFEKAELLTSGKAIIHDKIVVIDPLSKTDCAVAFGSHNLGYKASYCNDENMVIVRGNQEFALAYAVHVLDLWEHYRFRAVQVELREQGEKPWDGFLRRDDSWQAASLHSDRAMLSRYFAGTSQHSHNL
jgi:phosphatidylserine/phosphatidylglycerophosphate/cardiolipin synthase-like enzyme